VQAAVQEFRRLGYDATSMDAIAASAGVSKRTVYNHFPGKEDLFAAILQRLWETVMVNDRFDFIAPQTLASQLRQYLQQKSLYSAIRLLWICCA
jgi:TetR/AcrR family transcriptional regulator of autoinduction and epiphytic fitness